MCVCVCVVVGMVVNLPTTICCVHWVICALIHEVIYKIIFNKQYFKLRKNIFFLISSLTFKNISGNYNNF